MKTMLKALLTTWVMVSAAAGAQGEAARTISPLTFGFLALGALILVFQLVPAVVLFASMIYGLFASVPKSRRADQARH